jgi:hypothetical protein
MSYWVKAILGLALFLVSITAFEYALWELMNTGTCASGGPYVSARPCPEGTAEKALLLPAGFILGFIGMGVFTARGRRPGAAKDAWQVSPWLVGWAPLFIGTGIVALVAGLQAEGPDAGAAKWTGIFLAALFIPMGLAPVPFALPRRKSRRRKRFDPITKQAIRQAEQRGSRSRKGDAARPDRPPRPAPAPHPVTPTPVGSPAAADPIDRLRKLGELRDKGVLSPDEFAAAKSRILSEL